ncbi:MAG TPA: universal stress protein [Burkholderiales bacterium]|jgi:nucleotide-binding universal stress UspA family protein|nr:universal stress protein [Burkholderiales bacterium]
MYSRILVGYDGSAPGKKAFDTALNLAARDGAELHVLSVVRTLDVADDVETEAMIENSLKYHREMMEPLLREVRDKRVSARFDVVVGHPAEQIIYKSDEIKADLIVVGDRGRSKFTRLLLGSVSRDVVQHAGRQVLVVR